MSAQLQQLKEAYGVSRKIVGLNDFEAVLKKIIKQYGEEVRTELHGIAEKVGKEAAKKINQNASQYQWPKQSKSWKTDVKRETLEGRDVTVHSTDYHVSHLLEFGHAKANGGRTKAFEFIAPVEEWAVAEVEKQIKQMFGG